MADNIGAGEADGGDAFNAFEAAHSIIQARSVNAAGDIDLFGIAANYHPAIHAKAREKHLHLCSGCILRFIEDDETICERPPAHKRKRCYLDLAAGDAPLDLFGGQAIE